MPKISQLRNLITPNITSFYGKLVNVTYHSSMLSKKGNKSKKVLAFLSKLSVEKWLKDLHKTFTFGQEFLTLHTTHE